MSKVLSDLTCVTGQAILRAIVAGARDAVKLAQWRHPACPSSTDQLAKALTRTWRAAPRLLLQQALALYDDSIAQLRACAAQIERQFVAMKPHVEPDHSPPTLPPVTPGSPSKPKPGDNVRAPLRRLTVVDLVAVPGSSASIAQTSLSEVGTDRRRFPTVKHCCAWLGLAPHTEISGGREWRSRTLTVANRATQAVRQVAQSLARSPSAFGASCRSMRARLGPAQATVATAQKSARVG
jgi:transposase